MWLYMKKILFVQGMWANGGIEKVVDTYCKYLIPKGYIIDVFAFEKSESVFSKELENLGVKIISPNSKLKGGYIERNKKRLNAFLEVIDNEYDIIHYNTSFAMAYIHCYYAKKKNNKTKIVMHSHGDYVNAPNVIIKRMFNSAIKYIFKNIPDYCIGCSEQAGEWLFSKKRYNDKKYKTIMNAIDLRKYKYDINKRKEYHTKWRIEKNELVIGTIGRFSYQKNPYFILEIINSLVESSCIFKFIWIGEGEEKNNIKRIIIEKNLSDYIILIDATADIPGCLSGFDMMILPSIYEGLGLVLLEAQASGLITLASDTIPKIAKYTDRLFYLNIEDKSVWRDAILQEKNNIADRDYPDDEIQKCVFNVDKVMEQIIKIYEHEL